MSTTADHYNPERNTLDPAASAGHEQLGQHHKIHGLGWQLGERAVLLERRPLDDPDTHTRHYKSGWVSLACDEQAPATMQAQVSRVIEENRSHRNPFTIRTRSLAVVSIRMREQYVDGLVTPYWPAVTFQADGTIQLYNETIEASSIQSSLLYENVMGILEQIEAVPISEFFRSSRPPIPVGI